MPAKIENVFDGYYITLNIPAQRFTGAQRAVIKKAYAEKVVKGVVALQQHCAVAEATNEALGGVYNTTRDRLVEREILDFGGVGQFALNTSSQARFGIDSVGKMFLTVGLAKEDEAGDSTKLRLTWKGNAIPETLARVAVAHDSGESHDEVEVQLQLGDAQLRAVRVQIDKRPYTPRQKKEKNTPEKNVADYRTQPRKHRRICSADLAKTYGG